MSIREVLRREDVFVGLVLLAFGGTAAWLALGIAQGPAQRTLPPSTIPLMCAAGIAACGLGLMIRGLVRSGGPAVRLPMDLRQFVVLVLFAGFFWVFDRVDFRLLILIFVPAVMVTLGCRSFKQVAACTLATMAGVWLFFGKIFSVFLPTWI